jgi:hypothetical protein
LEEEALEAGVTIGGSFTVQLVMMVDVLEDVDVDVSMIAFNYLCRGKDLTLRAVFFFSINRSETSLPFLIYDMKYHPNLQRWLWGEFIDLCPGLAVMFVYIIISYVGM